MMIEIVWNKTNKTKGKPPKPRNTTAKFSLVILYGDHPDPKGVGYEHHTNRRGKKALADQWSVLENYHTLHGFPHSPTFTQWVHHPTKKQWTFCAEGENVVLPAFLEVLKKVCVERSACKLLPKRDAPSHGLSTG